MTLHQEKVKKYKDIKRKQVLTFPSEYHICLCQLYILHGHTVQNNAVQYFAKTLYIKPMSSWH